MVEIEIDGTKIKIPEGSTIIEAADQAHIYIPRFCYHRKLSIAANCRMCLVEVENSRKPLPACATPVTDGMKVMTRSPMALKAQRDVMEFLLINHPLDCPICDQGGECELQDLSMGYGRACSEYNEPKRAVPSEDIGHLIETWMTRCIHCTRCVRFGEEIAGLREMGMTFRGEHSEIGTYVKHFLKSEISGNIIDLCPVGALTNKPARYEGRAWEYREHATIAPHDCVGGNLFVHSRGRVIKPERYIMRAVPRECEAINETWCSDRDRYSVHALYHKSRVYKPRIKQNGKWVEVEWQRALDEIADRTRAIITQKGAEQLAGLASSSSTVEELYLFQQFIRALGSHHVDHRLREQDFSDQEKLPAFPKISMPIADVEELDTIVLIGSNMRFEQPMLSNRINKATGEDATVIAINPMDYQFTFPVTHKLIAHPQQFVMALAGVTKALAQLNKETIPELTEITPCEACKTIATKIHKGENVGIFLGEFSMGHEQASVIRSLTHHIQRFSHAKAGLLTSGANGAGAWLAGCVPHRGPAGKTLEKTGLNAKQLLTTDPVRAYFLLNIEPELDSAFSHQALKTLEAAGLVVCLTPFSTNEMENYADFILPISPFTETAGTYVNLQGKWQGFSAATIPHQQAKPAWKVLRVLANFLELKGFEYKTVHEVQADIKHFVEKMEFSCSLSLDLPNIKKSGTELFRLAPWLMYSVDNIVRRAKPLQQSITSDEKSISVNQTTADALKLKPGEKVKAIQADSHVTLPIKINHRLPDDTVLLPAGMWETMSFGNGNRPIQLEGGQA